MEAPVDLTSSSSVGPSGLAECVGRGKAQLVSTAERQATRLSDAAPVLASNSVAREVRSARFVGARAPYAFGSLLIFVGFGRRVAGSRP